MNQENTYNNIDQLIVSYLSGQIEPADLEKLGEWVDQSVENKKYFNRKQEIWMAALQIDSKHFESQKAYQRFLNHTENHSEQHIKIKRKPYLRTIWYGAAVILLLIGVSSISYWQGSEKLKTQFTDITVEAPFGSQIKMYLPDGTLVWLNSGSQMSYSQGFGVGDRNVSLMGEAYFEVTKNEKIAFTVTANELTTQVLGTKFNFKNYEDDDEASVSLIEGNVSVNNNVRKNNKVNLQPNQKVFLNKRTGEMRVSATNAKQNVEWTNGNLSFDEEILPDIIKELERNYNVKITLLDDSLKTFRFYATFAKKDCSIEDILDMLAATGKIKYKINNKEIELSAK